MKTEVETAENEECVPLHAFYRVAASISQRIPVIIVRKMSYSGPSLLLLLLPSIHEKTIYGVNVMGAIRKLFSYWFSLKWEENGAAFFFRGNFALFSCGNSTAQTIKNVKSSLEKLGGLFRI